MDNAKDSVFKGKYRELLRLHPPTYHHGAQDIGFIPGLDKKDPDYGLLYLGFGDGGSNNIRQPQWGHHLRSFLGTILRLDPAGNNSRNGKYGIPAGNPFVNETDPSTIKEIYAYGFRNPHRLAWDPANGNRMMVADIGEWQIILYEHRSDADRFHDLRINDPAKWRENGSAGNERGEKIASEDRI